MKNSNLNLITVGYARQALLPDSREFARFKMYARELRSLSVIVFTERSAEQQKPLRDGNLTIYPTNSRTRVGMLIDAYRIGRSIVQTDVKKSWMVSSQDPFETSLVGTGIARGGRARHHVQLHGDNFSDSTWRVESLLNRIRYWFGLSVLKKAERIRVVSERIKRSLVAIGIPETRITVLPIRPELERFLAASHTVGNHVPFIFLAASRFSPEKNLPLIVRAFASVHTQHPHTRLRLVGKGKEEPTIRALVARLGLTEVVSIVPWTDAIEPEMQCADVFLLASNHEAYALTLIEAMAVGLPLVTTDVGCVGEVVIHGTHGLVVPPQDEVAFAQALMRMVEDIEFRRACSVAGRQTAETLARRSQTEYVRAWVAALSGPLTNV